MSTAEHVLFGLMSAIVATTIMSVIVIAARSIRRQEIVPFEPRRPVPWRLIDLLVVVSLWISLQAGTAIGVHRWLDLPPDATAEVKARAIVPGLIGDSVSKIVALALGVAWLRLAAGATWRDLGLDFRRHSYDVQIGVLAFGAVVFPVYGIQSVLTRWYPYEHPVMEMVKTQPIFAGIAAVIMAPITEELIFRVVLQGWLEARSAQAAAVRVRAEAARQLAAATPEGEQMPSTTVAQNSPAILRPGLQPILISSLVFAALHFESWPAPVPLFVFALVLGYIYQQTHRILPSVVVHALFNGCSLTAFMLSGS